MTRSDSTTPMPPTGRLNAEWSDGKQQRWRLEANLDRILLSRDDVVVDLPRATWSRDMYIATHAGGFIVRFETFEHSVGFLLASTQAAPFLELVGYEAEQIAEEQDQADPVHADRVNRTELLWPKVSPLAVWALLCAAPSFIPIYGLPFAVASVVLLVQHRRVVRRSAAWRHSRVLCWSTIGFLALGLPVSGLAWAAKNHMAASPVGYELIRPVTPDSRSGAAPVVEPTERAQIVRRAGIFDEEHNWGLIAAALVVVLLSLTIHEGAHAISAWWLGDDFAKRLGRVTINPLAHIDPIGTVLLPLILFLSGLGIFGWARPVPVRTESLPNPRRAHIWIALAGPGSNLLMAAAALMLLLGIGCGVALAAPGGRIENLVSGDYTLTVTASGFALAPIVGPACTVLKLTFLINTFLAFFNLIPIPPLDGSWVLEHSFPRTLGPLYARVRPYAFMLFLALIFSGLLVYLLLPAVYTLTAGLALIRMYTPY